MQEDTFISHLMELRDRLLRSIIAIGVVFLCLFPFASDLYDLLAAPMIHTLPAGSKMIATGVITPFLIPVKIAGMIAFLGVLPYVLYQAWAFVAPGLYSHEKKLVLPLIVASTLLFVAGIAFCYFFVFGVVFAFVNRIAPKSITVAPDIEQYLNFVLTMFLAFGVTFEVPVAVVLLARMGVVTLEQLKNARPYFVVGAFVVSAVVTPPDVVSQLLLAIPMCLLYELGLIAAKFVGTRKGDDDYVSPTDAQLDGELDRIDAKK
ncbi:MAG: Sec-independent protein translocase protein TatC [Betaproteobacteria bacterium]|nr:Sec-independent protein translocase protein TatC [Betaproteobacteria bacterium]